MKLCLALLCACYAFVSASAQVRPVYDDDKIGIFKSEPDSTFYSAVDEIFRANNPVTYVALFPKFSPLSNRRVPLQFGEGVNGYILEAVTDMQYTVMQGRRLYANHFFQTAKLSIRYAPAVRMTQDNSSNVLPTNQKIGLQLEKVLWDSYTGNGYKGNKIESYEVTKKNFAKDEKTLHMLYLTAIAMHYSNGQPEGVWLDEPNNRNDYIKGDFSTNILSVALNYSKFKHNLFSTSIGYQRDGNWAGPFSFITEQKKRYGQNRAVGYLQLKTKPLRNPFGKKMGYFYLDEKQDTVRFDIDRKWEWKVRADYEYIFGDLSNYLRNSKYRFGTHIFFEGMPLRSRNIGYLLHLYYGRDYFNIRYDDPVFAIMGGLSFSLPRYRNPRFRPTQAIIDRGAQRDKPTKIEKKIKQLKK